MNISPEYRPLIPDWTLLESNYPKSQEQWGLLFHQFFRFLSSLTIRSAIITDLYSKGKLGSNYIPIGKVNMIGGLELSMQCGPCL